MNSRLPGWARVLAVLAALLAGLLPSALFFVWIERNCALPWISYGLGWPWWRMSTESLALLCAWDVGLILLFGVIHTLLAQPRAHEWIGRLLPLQLIRSFYVIVTGLTAVGVMAFWQHTGEVLWAVPISQLWGYALSMALYWGLLLCAGAVLRRFDTAEFLGISQIYQRGGELDRGTRAGPALQRTGVYARVRHPVYAFLLLAVLVAPVMTLDRLLVAAGFALYLGFGIPIEERKLIAVFGTAYLEYRRQVPAIVPRLFRKATAR